MIKPITEEYFDILVGDNKEYIKKPLVLMEASTETYHKNCSDKSFPFASTNMYLYFEKSGEGAFVYVDFLNLVIIPKVFESMTIYEDEAIDFSDWKLIKLSDTPDKIYTKNCLSYSSDYHDYLYICQDLMNNLEEGQFRIKNDRIGFSTDITLRQSGTWTKELLLGYPERLKTPYDMPKLRKMDRSLRNMLIWTQNKH